MKLLANDNIEVFNNSHRRIWVAYRVLQIFYLKNFIQHVIKNIAGLGYTYIRHFFSA